MPLAMGASSLTDHSLGTVAVFCGSSFGAHAEYVQCAQQLGRLLARQNQVLVYGGGKVGLMGVLADAALQAGGRVIGVIPQLLFDKEVAHPGLSELRLVDTMAQRKELMIELADAFIALPGGIGTLDELFEVWTATQLGLADKPCGLLNVRGYFDDLLKFLDHAQTQGFLRDAHRAVLHVHHKSESLLQTLALTVAESRAS